MSVYVDKIRKCLKNKNWEFSKSCHLFADTEEELHKFAKSIRLKREWFQDKNKEFMHYDITPRKRFFAIRNGAIEVTMKDLVVFVKSNRSEIKKGEIQ